MATENQPLPQRIFCLWFAQDLDLQDLAEACLRFSPQIFFTRQALFIEVGKCYRLYTENAFQGRLAVILRQRQLLQQQPRWAIADNLLSSLLQAKFSAMDLNNIPLQALQDVADPLPALNSKKQPHNADLQQQKQVEHMIEALSELGTNSLQDFVRLPRRELAARFGAFGILCHQRLLQEMPIPWRYWQPEPEIEISSDYSGNEWHGELDTILFVLKGHLDFVFQKLWGRGWKLEQLQVHLICEANSQNPYPKRTYDFAFLLPQSSSRSTLQIVKERLQKDFMQNPVLSLLVGVQTKVIRAGAGLDAQKNLLDNKEEVREAMVSLLEQLRELHGVENVFQASLCEDRRPEKSWQKVQDFLWDKQLAAKPSNLKNIPKRPTYLLRKPEPVQILDFKFISFRQRRYRILQRPADYEKISGGWADPENQYARTYFTLDLEGFCSVCIFRQGHGPEQNRYFLHGYYG